MLGSTFVCLRVMLSHALVQGDLPDRLWDLLAYLELEFYLNPLMQERLLSLSMSFLEITSYSLCRHPF